MWQRALGGQNKGQSEGFGVEGQDTGGGELGCDLAIAAAATPLWFEPRGAGLGQITRQKWVSD